MPASGSTSSRRSEKYPNSRVGSLPHLSMTGSTAAKSVAGWRFAPACCAAQSVFQALRKSALQRSMPAQLKRAGELQNKVVCTRHRAAGAMQHSESGAAPVASQPVLGRPARSGNGQRTLVNHVCPPGNPVPWRTAGESNGSQTRRLQIVAVLTNHSVNRTHCGRPSFGL